MMRNRIHRCSGYFMHSVRSGTESGSFYRGDLFPWDVSQLLSLCKTCVQLCDCDLKYVLLPVTEWMEQVEQSGFKLKQI